MSVAEAGTRFDQSDRKWMAMAVDLARRGVGKVEPNPAVGAVLVKKGRIIGRGYHRRFGSAHAEIDALKNCTQSPKGATLYVTLEPCCHHGKTPPCTEAILAAGIRRVVAACRDPFSQVSGKGIGALRKAGLRVDVGLLRSEAQQLNAWYFKFHRHHLPYVTVKWAQTIDGKWAARSGQSRWITGVEARRRAHRLRARCDAVLVGVGTVRRDDPMLNVRLVKGTSPRRIVVDAHLRIGLDRKLVRTADRIETVIACDRRSVDRRPAKRRKLERQNCQVLPLPSRGGKIDLRKLLERLADMNIQRLLVEGGATLTGQFLKDRLADEAVIFIAPTLAADARALTLDAFMPALPTEFIKLVNPRWRRIGADLMIRGAIKYP